jgi:hypothetical protein
LAGIEVDADAVQLALEVNAVMERICSRCGEPFTWDADVTGEVTAQPTATEPGETTYTATVVVDGVAYTDVYTEEISALGLPADDPFWTDAPEKWTSKKAWEGDDFPKDHKWDINREILYWE